MTAHDSDGAPAPRGTKLYECVPNVSEGRDAQFEARCARAICGAGARLAHQTTDAVHNRSVFTFFGTRERVRDAAVALARVAALGIDLRAHRGAHPRIGALDVLPFIALADATLDDARALAYETATAIWDELRIPSFFYGAAAAGGGRLLADVRRGEFEGLAHRSDTPDVGDVASHPSAGAIAVGARGFLIAFNVVLASGDLALAQRVARTLRERNGGLRSVRALGIALGDGRVQVSFNLTDPAATPLDRIVGLVRVLAAGAGVSVAGCELIGLLPRSALATAAHRILDAPSA